MQISTVWERNGKKGHVTRLRVRLQARYETAARESHLKSELRNSSSRRAGFKSLVNLKNE